MTQSRKRKASARGHLAGLPPLLSISEVQALLHLKRRSVTRLLAEGRLRGPKITRSSGPAGRRLILRSSLEELIAAGMDEQP